MRRQDIQLLALARQGDISARCEAGRRYLLGVDGFPQHIATGLDYLTHSNVRELPQAARIVAESLPLQDIVQLRQEATLARAAAADSTAAQAKLGAWLCLRHGQLETGTRWLDKAASGGHPAAASAATAARLLDPVDAMSKLLRTLTTSGDLDGGVVAMLAAQEALAERDVARLSIGLATTLALASGTSPELSELISAAVRLAEEVARPLIGMDPNAIDAALDSRSGRADRHAAYALGRALCGIPCGVLPPESLCTGPNLRKGVALLLRAADAGCDEAWLHLYRMHGDHRLSVANPQMARFCLEKAAIGGRTEAQRKLGALMLRSSDTLADSEQAIQWLYQAATAEDAHAQVLLESLVLPLEGDDAQAVAAIEAVRRDDPWLAVRMSLSRHFGLTKLEALCVDPADGLRSWGLVVGKNPFISQIRLSAARAIPATSVAAMDAARRAASFFGQSSRDVQAIEGDLRRRSLRQRRAFERHGIDESIFFSVASSMMLETLRLGPKWAFRAKEPLQLALAA